MITYHALQRTQERTGYGIERSKRFIENAIKRGSCADDYGSTERDYLRHLELRGDGCKTIVYNTFCLIICEKGFCITMYPLPKWFGRKRHFSGKHVVRNIRKYSRCYAVHETECDHHYNNAT
jgi:hypothetical protein